MTDSAAATRPRDPVIDTARGLAMLLVLYAHALEMFFSSKLRSDHGFDPVAAESWRAIFAFHMPAFYFISGLTAPGLGRSPLRKVLTGSLALILLAEMTQIISDPIEVFTLRHRPFMEIAKRALLPLAEAASYNLVLTWFLVSIAVVRLLAWIHYRGGTMVRMAVWCLTILVYLGATKTGHYPFTVQTWGAGLVFFLMGQAATEHRLLSGFPAWAALPVAIGLGAILVFLYPLNRGCLIDPVRVCDGWLADDEFGVSMVNGYLGFLPLFFVTAMAGTAMVIALAQAARSTFLASPLVWIGRNTLTLIVINGATVAFIQPELANRLPLSPAGIAATLYALGMTAAQVGLLPAARPLVMQLNRWSMQAASAVIARLSSIFPRRLSLDAKH